MSKRLQAEKLGEVENALGWLVLHTKELACAEDNHRAFIAINAALGDVHRALSVLNNRINELARKPSR